MADVLVVDDDHTVREVVVSYLRAAGHQVAEAADGLEALRAWRDRPADLVVLDLMLPGIDGYEVCRRLRASTPVPIVMLTARGDETDRVTGLELGADDYVTKPFSPRELVLRIKKLLARAKAADEPVTQLRFGTLEIDVPRHEVKIATAPVTLTATEFKLLEILARRRGRVQTRERLLQDVWGYENPIDSRTVDTHMRRLREKIGPAADYLETIRGVGYRFKAEE
ncbi:MAG TPA: response regulator transcription factor [Opitutaceae bacterium]|nr:response regulator transcription factor [Opitutaceae bacterium]